MQQQQQQVQPETPSSSALLCALSEAYPGLSSASPQQLKVLEALLGAFSQAMAAPSQTGPGAVSSGAASSGGGGGSGSGAGSGSGSGSGSLGFAAGLDPVVPSATQSALVNALFTAAASAATNRQRRHSQEGQDVAASGAAGIGGEGSSGSGSNGDGGLRVPLQPLLQLPPHMLLQYLTLSQQQQQQQQQQQKRKQSGDTVPASAAALKLEELVVAAGGPGLVGYPSDPRVNADPLHGGGGSGDLHVGPGAAPVKQTQDRTALPPHYQLQQQQQHLQGPSPAIQQRSLDDVQDRQRDATAGAGVLTGGLQGSASGAVAAAGAAASAALGAAVADTQQQQQLQEGQQPRARLSGQRRTISAPSYEGL